MTLYFDENFPRFIPPVLRWIGFDAQHALECFPRGSADVMVFRELGVRGWIWVSHDKGAKRKPHERQALHEAGIGAFILTGRAQRSGREMLIFVLQLIEEMESAASRTPRPFIFGISDRRKFERLY